MLKKKAVSRSPKENSKSKGSAPPKRAEAKGSNLRAISGPSATAVGKAAARKPKGASKTTPKAVCLRRQGTIVRPRSLPQRGLHGIEGRSGPAI